MSSRRHKHEGHKHEKQEHYKHECEIHHGLKPMPIQMPYQMPFKMPIMTPTVQPTTQPMAVQRLAEASVPYQVYTQIWDPRTALHNGTVFPELYRPYEKK